MAIMTGMPVPKAATNLNHCLVLREYHVRSAGQTFIMEPVSVAETVKHVPQGQLRLCVD